LDTDTLAEVEGEAESVASTEGETMGDLEDPSPLEALPFADLDSLGLGEVVSVPLGEAEVDGEAVVVL
jgi:hypothetical protein